MRGIFQGDSLSPLFILCMVSLIWLLRRAKAGYEWGNKGFKLNHLFMDDLPLTWLLRIIKAGNEWGNKGFKFTHLLFMDDLKLFAKSKNQIDSLVQTAYIQ